MKTKKTILILMSIMVGSLLLSILLAGCGNATPTTKAAVAITQTRVPPATRTITSTTSLSGLTGTITEAGSTTVQPLAERLANAFMADNPKVKIVIQGGGSSVGIKAVNDGTVDIGAASRELNADESGLVKHLLARDGIAIIVHPANSVQNLTKNQVKEIFAGKIDNWKEVGGPDKPIHVAVREEGSGTRTAFEEMVMGKDTPVVKTAILQSSNGAIVKVVKGDIDAISFVSFGYLDSTIKGVSIDGIAATPENARNGIYPIVRPLYFLTKNEPAGLVKAFIDYCKSESAQTIIAKEGFISVY